VPLSLPCRSIPHGGCDPTHVCGVCGQQNACPSVGPVLVSRAVSHQWWVALQGEMLVLCSEWCLCVMKHPKVPHLASDSPPSRVRARDLVSCSTLFSAALLEHHLALKGCLTGLTMSQDSLTSHTSPEIATTPACHEQIMHTSDHSQHASLRHARHA
jgi:hypothetical protein